MNQGEHNRFSECGWFVCLLAGSGTQVDLENPVFLSSTSYTYDRLGRQLTAIAAGVSTNLYAYSRLGQLTNEVVQGLCASAPLRETISRAYNTLGRSAGLSVAGVGDPGSPYAVEYGYDAYGRFTSVTSHSPLATSDFSFTYSYLSGADLVSGMTASSGHAWSRSYEPARSLITAVENRFGNTVVSRFDYVNDEIGRRVSRADSGEAFQNPAFDVYSYNTRSEVSGAQRYHGTNPAETSRPFGGRGFGYDYDPIGNRLSASETVGGETLTKGYTANALNQYTAIANPDAVALRGVATNTATVTVNGNSASRDSIVSTWTPWHHALPTDNANGGVFTFAEIMAAINPPGTNTPDLVSTASGNVYAPPQEEVVTYDDDGNLLSDGRWQYTWNGENRLIKAEELVSPTNRQPYVVEYAYDHQGRMAWKTVASPNVPPFKNIIYLWDDFNIIAETTVADSATNTTYNVWGLDLNGTMQGAGGVGGLLAVIKDSATYIPAYDANGNVMEYVSDDGAIAAHREYDPFGATVVSTGETDAFSHWFSTKPWCPVTGLSEYQYRKYSPMLGRWLSRDPIEEEGGNNLYASCWNDGINGLDFIGHDRYITHFDILNYGDSGGTQFHVGVAVDTWMKVQVGEKDCCWVWMWTGIKTFDFGPAKGFLNRYVAGVVLKARGTIVEKDGMQLRAPNFSDTEPEQDIKMLEMIQLEKQNPPFYNFFFHQCLFWSVGAINYGMNAEIEESCYNKRVIEPDHSRKF